MRINDNILNLGANIREDNEANLKNPLRSISGGLQNVSETLPTRKKALKDSVEIKGNRDVNTIMQNVESHDEEIKVQGEVLINEEKTSDSFGREKPSEMQWMARGLQNASEVESKTKDVDIADVALHTKSNIVQQSDTAMMAQANVASQSALNLL